MFHTIDAGFRVGFFLAAVTAAAASEYYVATDGDDLSAGTRERPFATLRRARDAARTDQGSTVWLRGGVYRMDRPFELGAEDSGTEARPTTFRAFPGESVRLTGGRALRAADFTPVSDPRTLQRLQPAMRDKVVVADLALLDVQHIRSYPDLFTDNGGIIELFFNNRRMPLAIYPNAYGQMTIREVVVNGGGQEKPGDWQEYYNRGTPEKRKALGAGPPRPGVFLYREEHQEAHARWAKVLDRGVWLKGYWRIPWQNETVRVGSIDPVSQTVTLAVPVGHGIGNKYMRPKGSGREVYWVMNLPEEIDRPGEWAIDFKDKKLYFYPPSALEEASIAISDTGECLVRVRNADYVDLIGLVIEGSLSDGVHIEGGRRNRLRGCTLRNITRYAIRIEKGFEHSVESCDIYAIGAGGVWLSGGDSAVQPRLAAGHRVINCDIHHFGEIERVYAPGINVGFIGGGGGSRKVDAVGMHIAHNAIHHCPHAGVLFNSFDNLFEYNEVFQYCLVSNDMGAFYSYSQAGAIGHETFRYNFMHSSPEGDGLYYDNITHHPVIYGNIAYKLGPQQGKGRGTGFLVKNPTRQRVDIYNNVAVNCKIGYDLVLGGDYRLERNLSVLNQRDTAHLPPGAGGVVAYRSNPGFAHPDGLDFSMPSNAQVCREVPGFEPIPFGKIGLYRDAFRTSLPDYRSRIAEWSAREEDASGYDILDRKY